MANEYRSNDKINQMINEGELSTNYGFKNYIINGGFDIWQRGTSFSGGNKYTADRFKLQSNSTTDTHTRVDLGGNNYAVRVTNGSDGDYNNLFQVIENGKNRLLGKTVTVSCKARASKNVNLDIAVHDTSSGDQIQNSLSSSVGIKTEWTRVSATFTIGDTPNLTNPNLRVSTFDGIHTLLNGDWVEVTDVQLEEGSVATPFEHRPIGLELSLCQRYARQILCSDASGFVTTPTTVTLHIPVGTLRGSGIFSSIGSLSLLKTSFTSTGEYSLFINNTWMDVSGISINNWSIGNSCIRVTLTGFTGLTVGDVVSFNSMYPLLFIEQEV